MNNMNFRERQVKLAYFKEAMICIAAGTAVGLAVYGVFLYFHIAIFGWNLGLAFAPVAAGYVETKLANRIIAEGIGAISAFILFIYTTYYSFILKNPTLGVNVITIVSIAVILQAAFPTLVNYLIIVFGLGLVSYFLGIFTRITTFFKIRFKMAYYKIFRHETYEVEIETVSEFDEEESNRRINGFDFYFITSTDVSDKKLKNLGQFYATVIIEKNKHLVHVDQEKFEISTLNGLKQGKDDCLLKLTEFIKKEGGNGVVNLEIGYSLIGLGGDSFQVTATGMGVHLS